MSEAFRSTPEPAFTPGDQTSRRSLGTVVRAILYCCLAASLAVVVYSAVRATQDKAAMEAGEHRLVAQYGLIQPARKGLAQGYSDKDGGLVADPPPDAAELVDPGTLVVAYYEGDDEDDPRVDWSAFQNHLAQATGKEVTVQPYINSADQVAAIKSGGLHVVALHAADVPYLVNNTGLVPFAVLGTDQGASGNHLAIAVSAKSDIKSLADLRGRKLTCTRPDSITGYRSAIAVLSWEAGLRPNVDYHIHFSHGQKRSIRGLVEGDFVVAALSDDKLQSMLKDGEIEKSDIRLIYESQIIPRLTIGYSHRLHPLLAAKITAAIVEFKNEGAAAAESSDAPMSFVAIDYKKDFEFVRKIDDSFDPRIGQTASVETP
jgi:phosphonate transport system substrate-binding protein